ncbi:MAG: pilin [Candidatus Falkowbacteria bacterium]
MVYKPAKNKTKQKIFALTIALFFCLNLTTLVNIGHAQTNDPGKKPFVPLNPIDKLNVSIPGIDKLSEQYVASCSVDGASTQCSLPYIAIYIRAIFGYSMGIIGILSAISIMFGGIIYMTSAGNATRINTAKSWINGSVVGLIIGLSCYALLIQINPDLVGLKAINIGIVEKQEDGTDPVSIGNIDENGWTFPSDANIIDQSGGQKMTAAMAEKLIAASKCMKDSGYKIRVSSASRTEEQQKQIYSKNCGGATSCVAKAQCSVLTCCPFTPGTRCPHTSGQAIDVWGVDPLTGGKSITAQYKLQDCMEQTGFCLLASECWHFEFPQLSAACGSSGHNLNGGNCTSLKNQAK